MPTAPQGSPIDQVTLAQVQTAYPGLTTEQTADLPPVITAVSAEIAGRYPKVALRASYSETHDPGFTRTINLKKKPVLRIARIRADMDRVLLINSTNPAARRAWAEVQCAGEAASMTSTGLYLGIEANGVVPTPTLIDFATYPTVAAVAAQINLTPGWTAAALPGAATMASTDVEPEPGAKGAVGVGAGIYGYTRDLYDWRMIDQTNGQVLIYEFRPQSFSDPGQWWGTDPRNSTVRVIYDAGLNAPLPDVQRAAIVIIGDLLEATDKTGLIQTVKGEGFSYTLADPTYRFPDRAERILKVYHRKRIF